MVMDTSKINGYADMTAEEKIAALEAYEFEPGKNDDNAEITKLKNQLSKANSEAADYKKKWRDKATEAEAAEEERAKSAKEKDELIATLMRDKTIQTYKSSYLALGYGDELAMSTAEALADGKTDIVFANQKTFLDGAIKSAKAEQMRITPAPSEGGKTPSVTKEDYAKMTYEERAKLYQSDKETYDALTNKGE